MQVRPNALFPAIPSWGMAALVFGVALACAWPAMHGTWLWDDPAHVTREDLRTWDGLGRIWTDVRATQQYYPVLHSAFWIEHRLWGDAPFGYHMLNALLHATACCILAMVLRTLWSGTSVPAGAAWIAALLFAAHPVCVESVAWITEQKNTLSLVFYLLAGLAWLDFRESRRRGRYVLASLLFLLALGTKSVTATLPAALLVVLWWRHGTLAWRRDVLPLVPWFVVAAAAGLFTAWVERAFVGAEGAAFELSLLQRVALAARIAWFYLGKILWPAELTFFYTRWDVAAAAAGWIGHVGAALAVTIALWMVRCRTRGPLAAWLLYGGSLFPALGFFNVYPFQFSYVADHFQYLASACLIAAIAGGGAWLLARAPQWARHAGVGATLVAILALGVLAHRQSGLYRDNETLFRANIARVPDSWMAHHILAHTIAKSPDRGADAIAHYREAIRINPDFPDAQLGLAVELAKSAGTRVDAIAHYERALRLRPDYVEAHNNLGFLLAGMRGREADAEAHYLTALQLKPGFTPARLNLAGLLARSPARRAEAIAQFATVVLAHPDLAQAHHSLATLLVQTPGREHEAMACFEKAVQLEPRNVDALNSLGIACAQSGRPDLARLHWQRALEVDPGFAGARENLRRLEQMQGR